MNKGTGENKLTLRNPRLIGFLVVFFGVMLFYTYKLYTIQIVNGETYLARADENRISVVQEQTKRGIIYDRNGVVPRATPPPTTLPSPRPSCLKTKAIRRKSTASSRS